MIKFILLAVPLLLLVACSNSGGDSESATGTKESTTETQNADADNSEEEADGSSADSEEGDTEAKEGQAIKIGHSPSTKELAESAVSELEGMGYEVEIVAFNDYVQPNNALLEGSLDANVYQHEPYMDVFNEENGTDLQYIDRVAVSLFSCVSNKYEKIEDLPDGARIGIFQDTTNQDRSLRMLESTGLITLPEEGSEEGLYTLLDIQENKKNFEFVTLDINQLVTNIDDLDAAFVSDINVFVSDKEVKHTLIKEELDENAASFSVGIVVTKENADSQLAKDLIEAYSSDSARKALEESAEEAWAPVD